jgi:hypothetical protein
MPKRSNGQKWQASAGVDEITVADYEQGLETNLRDLCTRIHTGRYRPQPVRRVYIPKADGGRRPLGVPTLEDEIVQGAVAEMLSAIYEVDFLELGPCRQPLRALSGLRERDDGGIPEGVPLRLSALRAELDKPYVRAPRARMHRPSGPGRWPRTSSR